MTALPEPASPLLKGISLRRTPLAVLAVALVAALSIYATIETRNSEIRSARADFENLAKHVNEELQWQLDSCAQAVDLIGAIVDSSRTISRSRFLAFTRGAMTGLPSIQALNYMPRVLAGDRKTLEASVRAEGFPGFVITEKSPDGRMVPAGQRPEYYPVLYVEPFEENRAAFGFDLGSNPTRLEALTKARDQGVSVASGRISLVTRGAGNSGFTIFHPVFKRDAPIQTEEDRRNSLQGFSSGVFWFDKLFTYVLEGMPPDETSIWLLDKSAPPGEELLYSREPAPGMKEKTGWSLFAEPKLETTITMRVAQREWELRFASTPAFFASRLSWRPWFALGSSVIITVLLGMYLFLSLRLFSFSEARAVERVCSEQQLQEKISRIEEAEKEARDNEEKLQEILLGIKAATFTIDARTFTILDMNATAESLFGISRQDWIGKQHRDLLGRSLRPLDSKTPLGQTTQHGDDASADGEFLLERPDGKLIPLSRTVLTSIVKGNGYLFEVLFDISEKKALERQLGLAQKLESVGQLASGIAHEINTPIQYVSGNLGFLQEAFKSLLGILERHDALAKSAQADPALAAQLEELRKAKEQCRFDDLITEIPGSISDSISGVERVAVIVGAMKKFSHPDTAGKRLVDVNKAIESTLTISRNEWKYNAEMRTHFEPDLPLVFCSPGDFNQVILNLVVNAAHAVNEKYQGSGGKGLITVSTASENNEVIIEISDTGVGIPTDNFDRIYDPFFTTKEVGKGTGQGLAIVHSIVDRQGGTIGLESAQGEGTTFTLRFPVGQEEGS